MTVVLFIGLGDTRRCLPVDDKLVGFLYLPSIIPEWNIFPAAAADAASPTSFHSPLDALPANVCPCGF